MSGFAVPELSRTPTFPECLFFFPKCYNFSVLPYSASNFCLNFLISRDLLRVVAFLSPAVLKVMSMESFHCGKAFTHLALHNINLANKKLLYLHSTLACSWLYSCYPSTFNLVYFEVMDLSSHPGG